MKLFYKKVGEGKPLIILHGLFGMSDNWATLSKSFAEAGFGCYLLDQRNHGRSTHSADFNFDVMAEDIFDLINEEKISSTDIIGHSMGGKVAMFLALKHPEKISKMIIADMAPRYYPQHHQSVFSALKSVDVENIISRKEAEEKLNKALSDPATVQFLLKSLYWKDANHLDWRFGIHEIEDNIEEMGKALPADKKISTKTLFLRGERSGYINSSDEEQIKNVFKDVRIETISNAGHWVHAENPKEFLEKCLGFLKA